MLLNCGAGKVGMLAKLSVVGPKLAHWTLSRGTTRYNAQRQMPKNLEIS